jgi:hypothetical protein
MSPGHHLLRVGYFQTRNASITMRALLEEAFAVPDKRTST